MNGYNKKHTEKYKVLLLYGYHSQELLARDVGKEFAKLNLSSTRVVEYDDPHLPNYVKDHRNLPVRKFVKKYLPFDYLVNVHDSPRAIDTDKYSVPACGFLYFSKTKISKRLISQLENYSKNFEKLVNDRYVERRFIDHWKDMSSKYDGLAIELMPHYINREKSVEYLKGLVNILSSNPRPLHR